jgi:conjugative relaxase-like TrwC/TraI family protein
MFRGLGPRTGEQRVAPLWRADPRSKLPATLALDALKARAAEQGVADLQALAGSKALAIDIRAIQAAGRPGRAHKVKVETVERVCRKILATDPRELYGAAFDEAAKHQGKRVDARVAAFDHCFSDPKSVSLLAAAGGPHRRRDVMAGREVARHAALGFLQAHGVGVRRGHNGTDHHRGQGLFAVAFDHRMSRAGEPDGHTHVLVQNATVGPGGRWTALDSDRLYAHLMAADHLYHAVERAELTRRLGVRWGLVDERSGAAEIIGLDDRALIERFSTRRAEVLDWLDEHELEGIKASSAAAVATRRPKDRSEVDEALYARWQRELGEAGIGERELVAVCQGGRGRAAAPEEVSAILDELAGPAGLTAQAATFARQDVVDALAKRLPVAEHAAQVATQVEALTERFLGERCMVVTRDRRRTEVRYSTPDLMVLEQRLLTSAVERQTEHTQLSPRAIRAALDKHPGAGEDQRAAIRVLASDPAGVSVLVGRPGTGKTWTAGVLAHAAELDGRRVLATAPTGIAVEALKSEGLRARTVDSLLLALGKGGERLDATTLLFVDEGSMLGTRKLAPLLDHAQQAGAKVVLIADDRQLPAIDAGGGARGLRLRLGAAELTTNRRQVQAWERATLDLVRDGKIDEAITAYREHGRVAAFESKEELSRRLVADWWATHQASQPGEDAVILAHRRARVDQFNLACQQLRDRAGEVGQARLTVGDRTLAVGDRVVSGANAITRLGVANGTRGTVVAVDPARRTLTLELADEPRRTVTLPRWYLDAEVAPGQHRRVDLAYATTGNKSQGMTREHALVDLAGYEDRYWFYVQLSRARQSTRIYAVTGPEPLGEHQHARDLREPGDASDLLAQVIEREPEIRLAADIPDLPDPRRLTTRQLREERAELADQLQAAPSDRARELARAAARHEQDEQAVTTARQAVADAQAEAARHAGPTSMLRRREAHTAAERLALAEQTLALAVRQADRSGAAADGLRRHQQGRAAWLEAHAGLVARDRELAREGAWRQRADAHAVELDPPGELLAELGGPPDDLAARPAWWRDVAEVAAYQRERATSPPEDHPPVIEDHPAGPQDRAATHERDEAPLVEQAGRDAPHPGDGPVLARDYPRPAEHVGEERGRVRRTGAQRRPAGRPANEGERVPRRRPEDRAAPPADRQDRAGGEVGPRQRAGELAWVTQRLGRAQGSWARASHRIQSIDRRAQSLRREPMGRWVYREELRELREERARQVYYAWQARARVEQLGAWHAEVAGHQAARAPWRAEHGLPPEQPAGLTGPSCAGPSGPGPGPSGPAATPTATGHPSPAGASGTLGGVGWPDFSAPPRRPGRRWRGRGGPASRPWPACTTTTSSSTSAPTPTPPGRSSQSGSNATTTAPANADGNADRRRQHAPPHPPPAPHDHEPGDDFEDAELEAIKPIYQSPGLTVRPLTAEQARRLVERWTRDPPPPPRAYTPTPPAPPQPDGPAHAGASHSSPGASAHAQYRRLRAAEWAAWTRGLGWRLATCLAGGLGAGLLAGLFGLPAGRRAAAALLTAGGVGWRLRFRASAEARAWRRGAVGNARPLGCCAASSATAT